MSEEDCQSELTQHVSYTLGPQIEKSIAGAI